jgi:hypothetical protein
MRTDTHPISTGPRRKSPPRLDPPLDSTNQDNPLAAILRDAVADQRIDPRVRDWLNRMLDSETGETPHMPGETRA